MGTPLVSTLICTYNAESFVSKTLDSVIGQTYKNQEILIRDDQSIDNTLDILYEISKKDKRIKIFTSQQEGKKLGSYAGLNYLLDKAKGKYIAIQDHDDIWHSNKLLIQIDFLEKNNKYIGCGTSTIMYFGKSKQGYVVDDISKDVNRVIHTSLVFRNSGYRYDINSDFLSDSFFMKIKLCDDKNMLRIIPEVLTLHYYKESGNNYSELRFKLSYKNIKRYFVVYGLTLFSVFSMCYILINKLFPISFKKRLTFNISLKNKLKQKEYLEKNKNIKELLSYY